MENLIPLIRRVLVFYLRSLFSSPPLHLVRTVHALGATQHDSDIEWDRAGSGIDTRHACNSASNQSVRIHFVARCRYIGICN